MTINWHIESFESIDSTQTRLKERASQDAAQGSVITAKSQTSGHGRYARIWVSEEGSLYMSFLLRPVAPCHVERIGALSLICALSVFEAIQPSLPPDQDLMLKWPNDVLLNQHKCAGILIESDMDASSGNINWFAIGIGVNIEHAPPEASCLMPYVSNIEGLRDLILARFNHWHDAWCAERQDEHIRQKWLSYAHKPGARLLVKVGGQIEEGFFHDIDVQGNLFIRDHKSNVRQVNATEIYMGR